MNHRSFKIIIAILIVFGISSRFNKEVSAEANLQSQYAAAYNVTDSVVMYNKRGDDKMYPASITKLLGVYAALEKNVDLNKQTKVLAADNTLAAENGLYRSGMYGGETVTIKDLLYSILFMSGAESCYALARETYGNEANLVNEMNNLAVKWGMKNSHFTNMTGMHSDDHYTTCNDYMKVMANVWNQPTMRQVISDRVYTTSDGRHTFSSPAERHKDIAGSFLIGGKTGYTDPAERTFAGFSSIKGKIIATVTGKAPRSNGVSHITDCAALGTAINNESSLRSFATQGQTVAQNDKYVATETMTKLLMNNDKEVSFAIVKDEATIRTSLGNTIRFKVKKIKREKVKKAKKSKTKQKKTTLLDWLKKIFQF